VYLAIGVAVLAVTLLPYTWFASKRCQLRTLPWQHRGRVKIGTIFDSAAVKHSVVSNRFNNSV
jgi:hypothetical protein